MGGWMSRLMDRGQGSRKERGEGRGTSHDASVIINSDSARTWCATECQWRWTLSWIGVTAAAAGVTVTWTWTWIVISAHASTRKRQLETVCCPSSSPVHSQHISNLSFNMTVAFILWNQPQAWFKLKALFHYLYLWFHSLGTQTHAHLLPGHAVQGALYTVHIEYIYQLHFSSTLCIRSELSCWKETRSKTTELVDDGRQQGSKNTSRMKVSACANDISLISYVLRCLKLLIAIAE